MNFSSEVKEAKEKHSLSEEKIATLSETIETLKHEKYNLEVQIKESADGFESVLSKNKRLEDDLVAATSNKDELASSVSQLITNTNEMKNEIKIINMEHEKTRLKFE